MSLKSFYYHLPGQVYAYGPTRAENKREVRRMILRTWYKYKAKRRLPAGVQVWEA